MMIPGSIYCREELLEEVVQVELDETTKPGGLRSWGGKMVLDQHKAMLLMVNQKENYRIVLADGRSGEFFFTRVQAASDARFTAAVFRGTGPLAPTNPTPHCN